MSKDTPYSDQQIEQLELAASLADELTQALRLVWVPSTWKLEAERLRNRLQVEVER